MKDFKALSDIVPLLPCRICGKLPKMRMQIIPLKSGGISHIYYGVSHTCRSGFSIMWWEDNTDDEGHTSEATTDKLWNQALKIHQGWNKDFGTETSTWHNSSLTSDTQPMEEEGGKS